MKIHILAKELRHEAIAHPKKAVFLGLLVLAAIGFWTPLLWGWMSPESSGIAKSETNVTASNASTQFKSVVLNTSHNNKPQLNKQTWRETSEWIASDPRMSPVNHPSGRQHPFDPVAPPASASMVEGKDQQKEKTAVLAVAESALDPESLGVVLSSTIIGSQSQAALINGKSYRLGSTIRLDHDRRPIEFQLVEIRSDGIVLRRGEKSYEVCLPDPTESDRLEMTLLHND